METLKDKLTSKIRVPKMSASDWLLRTSFWPLLDVRSEGEYQEGHIPGSISAPILNNEERHQVGLTYKQKGQEEAIALGLKLAEPHRQARVKNWLELIEGSVAVTCWRGGLRSRFASGWLEEASLGKFNIVQITGGYKAIRNQLIRAIEAPREIYVLGGMTGSGKTALLQELLQENTIPSTQIVDLEGMAKHRGSAFGNQLGNRGQIVEQPRQATFENSLGMQLFQSQGAIVLENESSLIGKVFIPHLFRSQMKQAPLIILETSLQERIEAIFHEYVEIPLQQETPVTQLWEILGQNIKSLEKRLGGKDTALAIKLLQEGLSNPLLLEKQSPWIELLLVRYYDKAYAYALNRSQQKILFQGNKTEIKSWLIEKWASRKNG